MKLPGFFLGRLCLSHQSDPHARVGADDLREVLAQGLRRLLHRVHTGHHPLHANILRRVPTGSDIGAHAGKYWWRFFWIWFFSSTVFSQSLGVFGLCQIISFVDYLRANMSRENFNHLFKTLVIIIAGIVGSGLAVLTLSGRFAF